MQQIIFDPPDENAPGFLKRLKQALRFQQLMRQGGYTPEDVDGMVDFLLDYVTQPADREEARALLWDASQRDFMAMLEALGGESAPDPLAETNG